MIEKNHLKLPLEYAISVKFLEKASDLLRSSGPIEESHSVTLSGTSSSSLLSLQGLGKEIWQGIDIKEYISDLRRDWDD